MVLSSPTPLLILFAEYRHIVVNFIKEYRFLYFGEYYLD